MAFPCLNFVYHCGGTWWLSSNLRPRRAPIALSYRVFKRHVIEEFKLIKHCIPGLSARRRPYIGLGWSIFEKFAVSHVIDSSNSQIATSIIAPSVLSRVVPWVVRWLRRNVGSLKRFHTECACANPSSLPAVLSVSHERCSGYLLAVSVAQNCGSLRARKKNHFEKKIPKNQLYLFFYEEIKTWFLATVNWGESGRPF